jgi:hypothetical protein
MKSWLRFNSSVLDYACSLPEVLMPSTALRASLSSLLLSLLLMVFLLLPQGSWSQETAHSNHADLLARLAYNSSGVVARADESRDICLSVFQDGSYRVLLLSRPDGALRLKGKMPQEQLEQLKTLLWSDDFRALSGNHGGLIRQESQNFRAEVSRDSGTQRMQWLTADGENPFPAAVEKVVTWLGHFKPANGEAFEPAEFPDICPSVGLSRVQPTLAQSSHP